MTSRPETDRRPTPRRLSSAQRRLTIQAFSQARALSPRSVLRALADHLADAGVPASGAFSMDLDDIGVVASRGRDAVRTTYRVTDADRLAEWYLSGEPLTLSPSQTRDLAHVVDQAAWALSYRAEGKRHKREVDIIGALRRYVSILSRDT